MNVLGSKIFLLYQNPTSKKIQYMIKALIFDFDGLILDTETPELEAWQAVYHEHGHELSAQTWGQIVGGTAASTFNPATHLENLSGRKLDHASLHERVRTDSLAIIHRDKPRPGVEAILRAAKSRGLKLAVASSSPHAWVDGHLTRIGLFGFFDAVKCSEDVRHTKPFPDLFLAALEALGVQASEAVVFEDSPNGIIAARRAGIFAVAIPNPLTAQLRFEGENLRLNSFLDMPLDALLALVSGAG
jgi:HAD superfamily hydrolase (TIGR01509 family)